MLITEENYLEFLKSDYTKVYELKIRNHNFDFTVLAKCVNLKSLDCSNCGLKTIPYSIPDSVTDLFLDNNQITSCHNNQIPKSLTRFSITNNLINKFELNQFPQKLKDLNLSNNQIYEFDFDKVPNGMEYLDFSNNMLEKVILHDNLMDLKYLNLSRNQIQKLFISCVNLLMMDISYNELSSFEYFHYTTVSLNASHNKFTSVNRLLCDDLKYANFSYNYITVFDDQLPYEITEVDLTQNQILDFNYEKIVQKRSLIKLKLDGNKIPENKLELIMSRLIQ